MINRDSQVENIFTAFPKILDQIEADPDAREAFVFAAWRRSVGESMNEQTAPVKLSGSRLKIAVLNETWRRHLVDMAGEILFKVNSNLPSSSITFLDFFVDATQVAAGRLAHPAMRPKVAEETEAEDEITRELRDSAAMIQDEDLRKTFLLAAGSCLARSKRNLGKA